MTIKTNDIKRILKKTWLIKKILQIKKFFKDHRLYKLRQPYIQQLKELLPNNCSIISSNCFAGRTMQDLCIEYNSPTLGLWIMPTDFALFCKKIKFYLSLPIAFKEHSKSTLGEYKRLHPRDHFYPVGDINNEIEIHFLHYYNEIESNEKWRRRASRVNFNRILFIGMEQNGCTEDDIKKFDSIPYEGKLFFTCKPYPYKSVIFVKEFSNKDQVGDPYKQAHIFYKYLVKWLKENKSNIGKYESLNDHS